MTRLTEYMDDTGPRNCLVVLLLLKSSISGKTGAPSAVQHVVSCWPASLGDMSYTIQAVQSFSMQVASRCFCHLLQSVNAALLDC